MHITLDARYIDNTPGSTYGGGGIALYVQQLIQNFITLDPNLRLRLVVRPGDPIVPNCERVEEVVFDAPAQSLQTLLLLSKRIDLSDTDLFHAPANVLPKGLPCPSVATVHDLMWIDNPHLCSPFAPKRWTTGLYYRWGILEALHRASKILTVSNASRRAIAATVPRRAHRIKVTHNALDPYFRVLPKEETEARTANLVPPKTPFALIVGQGAPYKNHLRALKAFLLAFKEHPEWRLVLVRRFSRVDAEMSRLLALPEVQSRIIVLSKVSREDLLDLYNRAGLFLFPSLCEGFGLPIIEAMACGCPVVTSHRGAPREVAGEAAEHVDPLSTDSIAAGIHRVAFTPGRAEELRQRGLQRVNDFSWRESARATLDAYREVIAEHKKHKM